MTGTASEVYQRTATRLPPIFQEVVATINDIHRNARPVQDTEPYGYKFFYLIHNAQEELTANLLLQAAQNVDSSFRYKAHRHHNNTVLECHFSSKHKKFPAFQMSQRVRELHGKIQVANSMLEMGDESLLIIPKLDGWSVDQLLKNIIDDPDDVIYYYTIPADFPTIAIQLPGEIGSYTPATPGNVVPEDMFSLIVDAVHDAGKLSKNFNKSQYFSHADIYQNLEEVAAALGIHLPNAEKAPADIPLH